MGYTTVRTKNADYVISLTPHMIPFENRLSKEDWKNIRTVEAVGQNFDAYILEDISPSRIGFVKFALKHDTADEGLIKILEHSQVLDPEDVALVRRAKEQGAPIVLGDIPLKASIRDEINTHLTAEFNKSNAVKNKAALMMAIPPTLYALKLIGWNRVVKKRSINRRDFLKLIGLGSTAILFNTSLGYESSLKSIMGKGRLGPKREAVRAIAGRVDYWIHSEQATLRNAVIAEKVEETYAPLLKKILAAKGQNRRPRIFISYGTAHHSIPEMLKFSRKRRKIIRHYKSSLEKHYDRESLETMDVYMRRPKGWVGERISAPLNKSAKKVESRRAFLKRIFSRRAK